jgi:hypothetical protein
MGKKIYVVTGSEDGVLGAFGSKKKAIKAAHTYVGKEVGIPIVLSYVPSDFNSSGNVVYGEWCSAKVEELILNLNPLPEKETA